MILYVTRKLTFEVDNTRIKKEMQISQNIRQIRGATTTTTTTTKLRKRVGPNKAKY